MSATRPDEAAIRARGRLTGAALIGGVAVMAATLAGCSQLGALQQVSGVPKSTTQIAANDVLVAKKVPLKSAAVCEDAPSGTGYECAAETLTGQPIEITSPGTDPLTLVVKVDGKEIFSGEAQKVIDAQAEAKS